MPDLLGGHHVKHGDLKKLTWNLGRDMTGVSAARVLIRSEGAAVAVDRTGVIETPLASGLVSLTLAAGDYAAGKLDASRYAYRVEIETSPGPLTHPDSGYERLWVEPDLG